MRNLFLKSLFFFSLAAFSAVGASARDTQCVLPQSPRPLGLSLGMSPDEVRNVFGGDLKVNIKPRGNRTFFRNFIRRKASGSLKGVRALYLRFLDGKLYEIEIFYEERADAPTLEIFAARFAAAMNFPESAWRIERNKASIDCGAYKLTAEKLLNPRIVLTDAALQSEASTRRRKKSE